MYFSIIETANAYYLPLTLVGATSLRPVDSLALAMDDAAPVIVEV